MSALASDEILVTEIFKSIQGETSKSGLPFSFVRLTGCNLRCTYCDTSYAFKGTDRKSFDEIVKILGRFGLKDVLITGGEPLIHRNVGALISKMESLGYRVSVETHGELSLLPILGNGSRKTRIIMDIKTPGSGMGRMGFIRNLSLLNQGDEIKFVITGTDDLDFALTWTHRLREEYHFKGEILISPVHGKPDLLRKTAEALTQSDLEARLQTQLHKWIWPDVSRGI